MVPVDIGKGVGEIAKCREGAKPGVAFRWSLSQAGSAWSCEGNSEAQVVGGHWGMTAGWSTS